MEEYITSQGVNFSDFQHNLARFIDASTITLKKLENEESRGRPQNIAIKSLVNTLHQIFEFYYSTPPLDEENLDENDKTDNRNLSGKEKAEIEFIKQCLEYKNIIPPSDIRALLYNSETPENEKFIISKT